MLLRKGEFKCMAAVFVDCLCCVVLLFCMCRQPDCGCILDGQFCFYFVKNTGVNNISIGNLVAKHE